MSHSDESDDFSDKTSIVQSETFKGRIAAADNTPSCVVVLMGPTGYVGKQWPLIDNDVIIGRSVDCQIFIDDRSVSKSHAKFSVYGSDVSIMDMGSTNKTIINGQALPPLTPYKLKHNDQVKTGNVIFKFMEKGSIEAATSMDVYQKALKDALTGAYSKGALLDKSVEAIKRAEVLEESLSLIVFDLDHFKKINDTYGHPAGDYVLKELSSVVSQKLVRAHDFFARYGGEEFVIILSGTPMKQALDIAERIRTTIESHNFTFEGKKLPITVSLGVSSRTNEDWEELFRRADQALYTSKSTGRNKVSS